MENNRIGIDGLIKIAQEELAELDVKWKKNAETD